MVKMNGEREDEEEKEKKKKSGKRRGFLAEGLKMLLTKLIRFLRLFD